MVPISPFQVSGILRMLARDMQHTPESVPKATKAPLPLQRAAASPSPNNGRKHHHHQTARHAKAACTPIARK
ncbi:uncharacterized protein BKA78DRAFT_327467 [Phyllosticta capitalensis]|uniref:uncharacterized protein n=1 Tax=Phyllosticta capitalensis TaxID=121624 RepID=UPI00313046E0